jgi:hypothetical protein
MEFEKSARTRPLSVAMFLLVVLLVCVTAAVSIVYRDQNNANWLLIGLCKFTATFMLVAIALANIQTSIFPRQASLLIIVAVFLEALCDLFIEYSFTVGGTLSLIGLVFYSCAFITATSEKPYAKEAIICGLLCFCGFLAVQFLVVAQKRSFLVSTDGVFILYMLALSATTGIALSSGIPGKVKLGMFVFYISDFIVYFQMAHGLLPAYRIANAILYYAAQIIMVYAIFKQDSAMNERATVSA